MGLCKENILDILIKCDVRITHTVAIAVSGGKDSMVLLHLLSKLDFKIKILHVNFGLRGKESDEDEQFIKRLATSLKFDCKVLNAKEQIEIKSGIQEKAREIRYNWFQELYVKGEIDWLLTAHHSQDVAETVLLNLFRKTGLKGLSGISDRDFILRPLVEFSSIEIVEYASAHQILWREDSSNSKLDYSRNVIRNKVLPEIIEYFPLAVSNIQKTACHIREEIRLKESLLDYLRPSFLIINEKQFSVVDLSKLRLFSSNDILLFELIKSYGFNRVQSEEILFSLNNIIKGGIWLSDFFEACLSDDKLIIMRQETQFLLNSIKPFDIKTPIEVKSTFFECRVHSERLAGYENFSIPIDDFVNNIEIRFWLHGDRIKIKGGSKKISDVFNEFRVPVILRKKIPLLVINKDIVWVPGMRKDINYENISSEVINISIKVLILHPIF